MSVHHLIMTADITPQTLADMTAYLVDLKSAGATELYLAMSSLGGNVVAGIAIHNLLLAMPYTIHTHNIANIDSIANVIFLAGAHRSANANATFMFHGVGFDVTNERLEEKSILEKLDIIQSDHNRISNIISSKTSLSLDECRNLLKEQKTRDAIWAEKVGFVDNVADFLLPASASVKYLT